MAIDLILNTTSFVANMPHWLDGVQLLQWHPVDSTMLGHSVLGQMVRQTDLVGDVQKWFDNFIKTGQAWAFLIGVVLGYLMKTFTSFG